MSLHSSYGPNPLEVLPLSDHQCNNDSCAAFQAAHNASHAAVSYNLQFKYGHWTAWYYAVVIFCFTVVHVYHLYTARIHRQRSRSFLTAFRSKIVAAARFLSYRRFRGSTSDRLGLPSGGLLALLMISLLFLCILTFAVRPYYRAHRGYGSPPLAIRTGLMAAACTPLLVALSGKVNFITLLTGIGHERLNVLHRWVSYMCLGLSIAHTVPFLVAPLRDGGYAALHRQFYEPGAFEYTGVPPLAMLVGLTLFSIPFIRHRFYETFYLLHITLYIIYLGLCFWHFGQEGDSWTYLWATLAIWLATLLARLIWFNRVFNVKGRWMVGSPMQVQDLAGRMTRLDLIAPAGVKWRPGQHFFLRVPGLAVLGNHPFTAANAFREYRDSDSEKGVAQTITFFIRSYAGFTERLAQDARCGFNGLSSAWLEGPYGGIPYRVENEFTQIVLVAGGSGLTACLPWIEYLAMKKATGSTMRTKSVGFVWAVRHAKHLTWASTSLRKTVSALGDKSEFLKTLFYVTDDTRGSASPQEDLEAGKVGVINKNDKSEHEIANKDSHGNLKFPSLAYKSGRPLMWDVLPELVHETGRTLVISCGPESLKIDVSNTCAQLQMRVLKGECESIALHSETFGW